MFTALDNESLSNTMASLLGKRITGVGIILDNGLTLMGDLSLRTVQEYIDFAPNTQKEWGLQSIPPRDFIEIVFPRADSITNFHFVKVPKNRIGSLFGIYISKRLGDPPLQIRRTPSKLKAMIEKHDLRVVQESGLRLSTYFEKGLIKPPEHKHIYLNTPTPIYSDWDYFSRISGGIVSLGASFVIGGSVGWRKNLTSLFWKKLKEKDLDIEGILMSKLEYKEEVVVEGFLKKAVPEQVTEIEGRKWTVYSLSNKQWLPILLQERLLMMPLEFTEMLASQVSVYGELYPIPITIDHDSKDRCIKARAIARM